MNVRTQSITIKYFSGFSKTSFFVYWETTDVIIAAIAAAADALEYFFMTSYHCLNTAKAKTEA